MKRTGTKRVIAGFAILAGLIGLFTFSFFAGIARDAFVDRYTLFAVFPSAARLRVGSSVWIGGHPVGRVKAIGFRPIENDSIPTLVVRVELPRKHQSLIRGDSRARLTSERTIGESSVDITPGSTAQPALQEGDTIFGEGPADATRFLAGIVTLQKSLDSLITSAHVLSPMMARRAGQLQVVAAGIESVQRDFAIVRTSFTSGGGQALSSGEIQKAFASVGSTAEKLGSAFDEAAGRYTDPALRASFEHLRHRAHGLSKRITKLKQTFANSTLSRFAQDSALTVALREAQIELDSLAAETKRNPLRFWTGNR